MATMVASENDHVLRIEKNKRDGHVPSLLHPRFKCNLPKIVDEKIDQEDKEIGDFGTGKINLLTFHKNSFHKKSFLKIVFLKRVT